MNLKFLFLIGLLFLSRSVFASEASYLKERSEIQEKLIYEYAIAWDQKDCDRWANLFTTDAILDLSGDGNLASTMKRAQGRNEIKEFCTRRMNTALTNVKSHHFMTNTVFTEISPSKAVSSTYALVTWKTPSAEKPSIQTSIVYHDKIVKENGRWLLKERLVK